VAYTVERRYRAAEGFHAAFVVQPNKTMASAKTEHKQVEVSML
jgi:hypothetical protein